MVDYKKLYCKMFSASTKALHIIQQAQVECENMYLEMSDRKRKKPKVLNMSEYEACEVLEIDEEEPEKFFEMPCDEDDDSAELYEMVDYEELFENDIYDE